jgi:hypothetical protein
VAHDEFDPLPFLCIEHLHGVGDAVLLIDTTVHEHEPTYLSQGSFLSTLVKIRVVVWYESFRNVRV